LAKFYIRVLITYICAQFDYSIASLEPKLIHTYHILCKKGTTFKNPGLGSSTNDVTQVTHFITKALAL